MAFLKKILVPTDFSEPSEHAMHFALKLAGDLGACLCLLNVDDDPLLNSPTTGEEFRAKYEDRMATMLAAAVDDEQRRQLRVEYAIARGDAAEQICEYADSHDFDLIVMGAKGRSALADLLVGSVASKVLRGAKCPVVTVKNWAMAK